MKILKTYARAFVEDMDTALPLYEAIVGAPAHIRIMFEAAEIVGVGDFLIIAGPPQAIDGYRATVGPVIVENLDAAEATLVRLGCVPGPRVPAPTGELFYAQHPDGVRAEYLQWTPELVERIIDGHRR
jgi:hypothetical protein